MVRSSEPDATHCESWVHAISEIPWLCPESVARGESLRVSQTFTVLSAAVHTNLRQRYSQQTEEKQETMPNANTYMHWQAGARYHWAHTSALTLLCTTTTNNDHYFHSSRTVFPRNCSLDRKSAVSKKRMSVR